MTAQMLDRIKTSETALVPVLSAIISAFLGTRSTERGMRLQASQRAEELRIEREIKEREALKAWFEDYTITRCIDPLLAYVVMLEDLISTGITPTENSVTLTQPPVIPHDACVRLVTITGSDGIVPVLKNTRIGYLTKLNDDHRNAFRRALGTIILLLTRLKHFLLGKEIASKSDVFTLCNEEKFGNMGEIITGIQETLLKELSGLEPEPSDWNKHFKDMAKNPNRPPSKS